MKPLLNKNSFHLRLLVVFLLVGLLYSCRKGDRSSESLSNSKSSKADHPSPNVTQENADFVYEWFKLLAQVQLAQNPAPVAVANFRNFSFVGVGLYEAVQPGIKGASSLSPKLYQMPAMPKPDMSRDYLWGESANAALSSLLKQLLTGLTAADLDKINSMEATNYDHFKLTTPEDVLKRSEAFGRSIAAAIYNWSTTDGFTVSSEGYVPLNEPWAWVPTSPVAPIGAKIQYSRPFLEYSLTAIAPVIPIPYSEDPSSEFYKAAKEVHDLGGSTTVTPVNKATALWWADAGGPAVGYPSPWHLLSIVTSVLKSHHSGLWRAAEVYAKTGIGMKDGGIITFRSKYQYNLLRPITYIIRHIDPAWNSVLPAPPYPEYTSGLVGLYGPVINVLINEFGDIPVTDDAYVWRGLPARHFDSLSQLLAEAAVSRVYAGIHYRFTQNVSIEMGKELADQISKVTIVGPEYQ